MTALGIELRHRRLWIWSATITVGWIVIALLLRDRWVASWSEASLWLALPVIYLSGVIAAASADLNRARLTSGLPAFVGSSPRSRWRPQVTHLGASLVACALVPSAAAALVVLGNAWTASADGRISAEYGIFGFVFATGMVGLGRTVSGLTQSRVAGPLASLAVGLVFGLYLSPVPATNPSWMRPNLNYLAFLLVTMGLLLLAGELATRGVPTTSERTVILLVLPAAAVATAALTVITALWFGPSLTTQLLRTPAQAGSCTGAVPGQTVCVWPEDARFVEPLTGQLDRFTTLTSQLPWAAQSWTVHEPGLASEARGQAVQITPQSLGPGMWLTAQDLSFSLAGACLAPGLTPEQASELRVDTYAVLDATSNYVYGDKQPAAIVTVGDVEADQAAKIVEQVSSLGEEEQRAWIVTAWNDRYEACEGES